MGLLLASSRNIPWADRFIKSGKWGRKQFEGSELYGKTLGIIGLGRIGGLVSQRARGFAMRVIAYDPYIPDSRFSNLNVEKKDTLEELLREADFITIHTPRTKETLNMIADEQIALMKPGVRLVNCARGGLYNEEALYRGLKSGHIASLGVDTWVHEPQESHPLYEFETVVGTPHLGASTYEASKRVGEEVVAEVIAGLRGEIVKNAVNMPALSDETFTKLQAFILLAEQMGILYRQIRRESVKRVEIVVRRQGDRRPRGRQDPVPGGPQGHPRGHHGLRHRQLRQRRPAGRADGHRGAGDHLPGERRLPQPHPHDRHRGRGPQFVIAGTVLEHKHPRIVQIGDFPITFMPEGTMAYVPHKNVPGVIGRVGTIMGDYGVNISRMVTSSGDNNVSRDSIMLLGLDNDVPQEAIDRCLQMDEIYEMKIINF